MNRKANKENCIIWELELIAFFQMNGISFHDQFIPDINTIFDRVH